VSVSRRTLLGATGAGAVPLPAVACGAPAGAPPGEPAGQPARIAVLTHSAGEEPAFRQLFAAFKERRPEIEVDFSVGTTGGANAAYNEKLVSLVAAGDSPDVFKTAPFGFGQLAHGGAYLALDDLDDLVKRQAAQERFGEQALVLFSTDHGEMLGNHRLWGKNNCAYEDVWNVPLLARYPRGAPGAALHGTVQEARVMLTDVAPTCLRAAGLQAALPARKGAQRRGSAAGSCWTWWPTPMSTTTSWGARSTPSATCASRRRWKRPSWLPSSPERPAPLHAWWTARPKYPIICVTT